jgi:hypothetical protein
MRRLFVRALRVMRAAPSNAGRTLKQLFQRDRPAFDLDVVDQWALLTLRRHSDCSYRLLADELAAIRG